MSMEWFRWYHRTTSDPKFIVIARRSKRPRTEVIAVWATLLEQASEAEERGGISHIDFEVMAASLDIEEEHLMSIIDAMAAKGMIEEGKIEAWDRRQVQREDDSKERVRAFREREKQQQEQQVTHGNAPVTHGNAPVTPQSRVDTDTDKDKEKTSLVAEGAKGKEGLGAPKRKTAGADAPRPTFPPCPPWLDEPVWQSFVDHRKARRKPLTPQAAILTLNGLEKARSFGHDPTALIETAIQAGWTGCVFEDRHFQPARPATPGGGRAAAEKPRSSDPRVAEFEDILAGLKRAAIEGECVHVA